MRLSSFSSNALFFAALMLVPRVGDAQAEGDAPVPLSADKAPEGPPPAPPSPAPALLERLLGSSACPVLPVDLCFAPASAAPGALSWGLTEADFKALGTPPLGERPFETEWKGYAGLAVDGELARLRAELRVELAPFAEEERPALDPLPAFLELRSRDVHNTTTGEVRSFIAVFGRLEAGAPPRLVAALAANVRQGKLDFEVLQERVDRNLQPLLSDAMPGHAGTAKGYALVSSTEAGAVLVSLLAKDDAPPHGLLVVKSVVSRELLDRLLRHAIRTTRERWLKRQLETTGLPNVEELAAYRVASARKRLEAAPTSVLRELAPLLAFEFDKSRVNEALEEAKARIRVLDEARLGATLARELGKGGAVAIVPSSKGLLAVGVATLESRVLVPGPVAWTLVDPRAEVIWFGRGNKTGSDILLVDLRGDSARAEVIVSGLPANEPVAVQHGDDYRSFSPPGTTNTILRFAAERVDVVANGGAADDYDPSVSAEHAKAVGRARVATKRLAELAARTSARPAARAEPAPIRHVVKLDKKVCNAEENEACGGADELTGTPFWVVTVAASCGDLCWFAYQLYDPAKGEFFDPFKPRLRSKQPLPKAPSVEGATISLDGSAMVIDGRLLRLADGKTAGDKGLGGGFLGGDRQVVR